MKQSPLFIQSLICCFFVLAVNSALTSVSRSSTMTHTTEEGLALLKEAGMTTDNIKSLNLLSKVDAMNKVSFLWEHYMPGTNVAWYRIRAGIIVGEFNWTIYEARELLKRRVVSISSEPFYTHIPGYKMILLLTKIHEEIGLYAALLRGEFDDSLSWPFDYEIELSILNLKDPTDSLSIVITRDLAKEDCSMGYKRPTPEVGDWYQCGDFIVNHTTLLSNANRFLEDDVLNVRIDVFLRNV